MSYWLDSDRKMKEKPNKRRKKRWSFSDPPVSGTSISLTNKWNEKKKWSSHWLVSESRHAQIRRRRRKHSVNSCCCCCLYTPKAAIFSLSLSFCCKNLFEHHPSEAQTPSDLQSNPPLNESILLYTIYCVCVCVLYALLALYSFKCHRIDRSKLVRSSFVRLLKNGDDSDDGPIFFIVPLLWYPLLSSCSKLEDALSLLTSPRSTFVFVFF